MYWIALKDNKKLLIGKVSGRGGKRLNTINKYKKKHEIKVFNKLSFWNNFINVINEISAWFGYARKISNNIIAGCV